MVEKSKSQRLVDVLPAVQHGARRVLGNKNTPVNWQDASQGAAVALLMGHGLTQAKQPGAYGYKAGKYEAIDVAKHETKYVPVSPGTVELLSHDVVPSPEDLIVHDLERRRDALQRRREAERGRLVDAVYARMETLPFAQRTVVRLVYLEEMPIRDVAQQFHIKPNTVSAHLARGLQALREELTGD